jgi:hypothetical protein
MGRLIWLINFKTDNLQNLDFITSHCTNNQFHKKEKTIKESPKKTKNKNMKIEKEAYAF